MRLYSYVVALDTGFAPNPFHVHGYCTLATCKWEIRERARKGDWIIGTGSNAKDRLRGGRLVFAMQVTEILTFDEYFNDSRFQDKKPDKYADRMWKCGDNIYFRDAVTGELEKVDWSFHCKPEEMCQDTKSDRVLISDDFVYWGGNCEAPCLPHFNGFSLLCTGRKYRKFPGKVSKKEKAANEAAIQEFVKWFRERSEQGQVGEPTEWAYGKRKPWNISY